MALVKQRLPQAVYIPSPTEAEMLTMVSEWHERNSANYSVRVDTCINGYGWCIISGVASLNLILGHTFI